VQIGRRSDDEAGDARRRTAPESPNDVARFFNRDLRLPDSAIERGIDRMIGTRKRIYRLAQEIRMLVDPLSLQNWSLRNYGTRLALVDTMEDVYPVALFYGPPGTGKTATAIALANRLVAETGHAGRLLGLSTAVRGSGEVGEMTTLLNEAIDYALRLSTGETVILLIDEADSLVASRDYAQSHHEDKVAVNTLIQRIDETALHASRLFVLFASNRLDALDPAFVRRATFVEEFRRPDDRERRELFELDLSGSGIDSLTIDRLVEITGPSQDRPGLTFSDIRTKVLRRALARAYPDRVVEPSDLLEAAAEITGGL
jgi:SpoVK/Ycf46/Vps4 family AAA+-type ATPase